MIGLATRVEDVRFRLKVKKTEITPEIAALISQITVLPKMGDDDTLDVTYNFFVHYFGECAQKLEALSSLVQSGIVVDYDANELNYGRSLIIDLLQKLERVTKQGRR